MNSLVSFHRPRQVGKIYTITPETIPASLRIYWTIKNTDVNVDLRRIPNYASNQYDLTYTSNTFISTQSPFSNSNRGSMYVYQNGATSTTTYTLATATSQSASMSFWFKLLSPSPEGRYPFLIGTGTQILPEIRYNSSTGLTTLVFIYFLNNQGGLFNLPSINLNNWTHFCYVIQNGGTPILYVNGTAYNSTNGAVTVNTNQSLNGATINPYGGAAPNGLIAEIRIYQEALTAQRVQNIYTWNGADGTQPIY